MIKQANESLSVILSCFHFFNALNDELIIIIDIKIDTGLHFSMLVNVCYERM